MTPEKTAYDKHKNLKIAANEIGIKWQTLYARLKNQGVNVIGDKLRYGTDRDKLSSLAEAKFLELVPFAKSMNAVKWQHKYDFTVYGYKVDVKCSKPRKLSKRYDNESWAFSFKKQTLICDFVCCFCLDHKGEIERILLIPNEFFKGLSTISVSCNVKKSKWLDYSVSPYELSEFFNDLKER